MDEWRLGDVDYKWNGTLKWVKWKEGCSDGQDAQEDERKDADTGMRWLGKRVEAGR